MTVKDDYCERCEGTHLVDWALDEDLEAAGQLTFDLGVAIKQPCPVCSADDEDYE